ncbi:DUF2911 domain-containing protein [Psychroserpens mesophilus]|uniref:DUF2911 domain-containing protein n=1 Tax=Psychroserpens mesophilus TaxID=325473 RepID=UPI003D64623D
MKTSPFILIISLAFLMLFSFSTYAQEFSDLDESPMDAASFPSSYKESNKLIKIIYSRPQLKKRSIEKLVPNGEVWRTGANEAAELTLYKPMKFGQKEIPAGTYTFFIIPGDEEWTAIINQELNVWGSYFYNNKNDIARMMVPVKQSKTYLEAFSIAFEETETGINMYLGWGHTIVAVPFTTL